MVQPASLIKIYQLLLTEYGEQNWWPADSPFEVVVGAILTQNTNWSNVKKAIASLKGVCELTPESVLSLPIDRLEAAIRPSGYFRQKAGRLKDLCAFLMDRYGGDMHQMAPVPTGKLREELLSLKGIGPETADSILLYALDKPVFVIDAYTVRLLSRLGLCNEKTKYDEVQSLFMENLKHDVQMFNEYHALIIRHMKERCRKREPRCGECELANMCAFNFKFQNSNFKKRE